MADDDLIHVPAGWQRQGKQLTRSFKFKDWWRTMSFVNAVSHVASASDHHPDLHVGYGRCEVRLTTHDAGDVTQKDVVLAEAINRLPDL